MSAILTNPRTNGAYAAIVDLPTVAAGDPPLGGTGTLSGVVRIAGAAAARIVQVYDQSTLTLAAATVSNGTTGAWTVSGLSRTRPLRLIVRGEAGERDVTIQGVYAA